MMTLPTTRNGLSIFELLFLYLNDELVIKSIILSYIFEIMDEMSEEERIERYPLPKQTKTRDMCIHFDNFFVNPVLTSHRKKPCSAPMVFQKCPNTASVFRLLKICLLSPF